MPCRGLRAALGLIAGVAMTLGASRTARAGLQVERAEGADSCPDAVSFADRIREGGPERASGGSEITVRFEHTASGYRAWIRMPGGKYRALVDDAPSCDGLAEATVLAVKLALDLEAASTVGPALVPFVAGDPAPYPDAVASVARSSAPFAEISASGVVAFGIGSPAAPGMRASSALVFGQGRWSMGITGLVLASQTRDIGDGTVDVSVLGGGIEGCGRMGVGRSLLLALCGRAEMLGLQGSAHGFARTKDLVRPLFTGTLLGRARRRLAGSVAVFVEAGAVVPFVRERFAIDTVGVVYDLPILAAVTGIGILVDFE